MFQEWSLAGFKSVALKQSLQLRKLTVFAGANSSGKSTILQSMLLLAQTLTSRVEQRHLLLNGELARLGTFDDIHSKTVDAPSTINIGFKVRSSPRLLGSARSIRRRQLAWMWYSPEPLHGLVEAELTFGNVSDSTADATGGCHLELQDATFRSSPPEVVPAPDKAMPKSTFSVHRRTEIEMEAVANTISGSKESREGIRQAIKYIAEGLDPAHMLSFSYGPFLRSVGGANFCGVGMDHFLPSYLAIKYGAIEQRIGQLFVELEQSGWREDILSQWLASENDSVKQALARALAEGDRTAKNTPPLKSRRQPLLTDPEAQRQLVTNVRRRLGDDPVSKATVLTFIPPPPAVGLTTSTIVANLQNLRYLGPLRDEPRPLYGIGSGTDPSDVGNKGEFTAAVLDLFGSTHVDFVDPNDREGDVKTVPLRTAVHAWLRHFDMATGYETADAGKLGHHLFIFPAGINSKFDLTNVGVGLSQVLPILVMALISDPESILLFEQPELHLHPRVQSLLGDFFLSVTKTGRQCIVETHSEYLVNRLRRRVAESSWDSKLGDDVLLYFVERKEAQSYFNPIDINPFGAIPAWPAGFFDQGPEESECIMTAAAKKRASRKPQ